MGASVYIAGGGEGRACGIFTPPLPAGRRVTSALLAESGRERSPRAGGGAAPRCWEGRAGDFLQPRLRQLPSPPVGRCAALVPGRSRLPQRPGDMRERE